MIVTITQVGNRYAVDTTGKHASRLNVLNQASLVWNLKHVFGLRSTEIKQVLNALNTNNKVCIERVVA